MYAEYRWINRLQQFDSVDLDLVLVDEAGEWPDYRISRNYSPASVVTPEFLEDEACVLLAYANAETLTRLAAEQEPAEEEPVDA